MPPIHQVSGQGLQDPGRHSFHEASHATSTAALSLDSLYYFLVFRGLNSNFHILAYPAVVQVSWVFLFSPRMHDVTEVQTNYDNYDTVARNPKGFLPVEWVLEA